MWRSTRGALQAYLRAVLALACMLTAETGFTAPPPWFPQGDKVAFPTGRFFVATAGCDSDGGKRSQGERVRCAVDRAREDLGKSIASTVESVCVSQLHKVSQSTSSGGKSDRSAKVTRTFRCNSQASSLVDLPRTEPQIQVCEAQSCYALLALKRDEAIRYWTARQSGPAGELRRLMVPVEGETPLASLKRLQRATKVALEVDRIGYWLLAADPSAHLESAMLPVLGAMREVLSAPVCLASEVADVDPAVLFSGAKSALEELDFAGVVVKAKVNDCRSAPIALVFRGAWAEARDGGREWVRDISGTLVVQSSGVESGGTAPLVGHGVARNLERAKRDALQQLTQKLTKRVKALLSAAD